MERDRLLGRSVRPVPQFGAEDIVATVLMAVSKITLPLLLQLSLFSLFSLFSLALFSLALFPLALCLVV